MYVYQGSQGYWHIATLTDLQFTAPELWCAFIVHDLYNESFETEGDARKAMAQIEKDLGVR